VFDKGWNRLDGVVLYDHGVDQEKLAALTRRMELEKRRGKEAQALPACFQLTVWVFFILVFSLLNMGESIFEGKATKK
jgi:hypothetical protein